MAFESFFAEGLVDSAGDLFREAAGTVGESVWETITIELPDLDSVIELLKRSPWDLIVIAIIATATGYLLIARLRRGEPKVH